MMFFDKKKKNVYVITKPWKRKSAPEEKYQYPINLGYLIATDFLNKTEKALAKYNTSLISELEKLNIDENFIKLCENSHNKELINLIIAKRLWNFNNKVNLTILYKKSWYQPPFYLKLEWACTSCNFHNIFKIAKKTKPDILRYTCSNCNLNPSNHNFHFPWETKVENKQIRKKATIFKERLLSYDWPNAEKEEEPFRSHQTQYIIFQNYKKRLSDPIVNFLFFYHNMPKSEDISKDIHLAIKECNLNTHQLEKYGIIKTFLISSTFYDIAQNYANTLYFLLDHKNGGGWFNPFHGNDHWFNNKSNYLKEIRFFGECTNTKSHMIINNFFLSDLISEQKEKTIPNRYNKIHNITPPKYIYYLPVNIRKAMKILFIH